jgi:hypothetical protein
MKKTLFSRAARVFIALAVVAGFGAAELQAEPDVTARRNRRGFNLFASSTVVLIGNRVQCGLDNQGNTCTDVFGSPTGGGGFWPKNTPNQYIFNGGLQLAGILPGDLPVWAGDTVGAYIFDARGTQPQGEQLTLIYNSLDQGDVDSWPSGAYVKDGSVYNSALLGRTAISQQDSWVRYWDGNPTLLSGRSHPMGIMIEQRTLAWNFPSGNEDIIYVVYDFINITSGNASDYDGLRTTCEADKATAADPAVAPNIDCTAYAAEIAAIGAQYQAGVADRLGVTLPANGYTIDSMYASFSIDPDVGNAGTNSSTAILPFDMGVAYKSDFNEPTWFYPPDINGAPFGPYPGYVGVKYLKSPVDPATGNQIGLTLFSNTENGATAFPDPTGVSQLWRYLSGNVTALEGDRICSQPNPKVSKLCFLVQNPIDTRFYQSSGPFSLAPGQKGTIVVAFVHAAPIAAPLLAGGFTSGTNMPPLIPATGAQIAADPNASNPATTTTLRPLDFSAGWVGQTDLNADGIIQQQEVQTAPRSLLAKSLVAQGIFDANFLLPFAPEPPNYFLLPGDNQVTIVWSPSVTETVGDPYFTIAANTTSPLFDPNYRQLDVEGYRIYRGRTGADLELIAQFDYSGTSFVDFNGAWDYGTGCAPELGAGFDGAAGECPVDFSGGGFTAGDPSVSHDITGDMPQVSLPGRAALLTGGTLLLDGKLDTFWPDAVAGGSPGLTNAGVPFAFVDQGVINSTDYFYAVTAFDVNSVNSGPSSLESAVIATRVTPRAPAANATSTVLSQGIAGSDGEFLDAGVWPTIDPDDGTFSGNIPPITTGSLGFLASVAEALAPGDNVVRVDSVDLGWAGGFGPAPNLYLTLQTPGKPDLQQTVPLSIPRFNSYTPNTFSFDQALVPYNPAVVDQLGLGTLDTNVRMPIRFSGTVTGMAYASNAVATASGRYGVSATAGSLGTSRYLAHSRWLDVGGSEAADPTITSLADSSHNAGSLTGVGRIWAPSAYRVATSAMSVNFRGQGASGMTAWYPADFVVTWNADGSVDVRDVTHNTDVPEAGAGGSGEGFINITDLMAVSTDQATWSAQVGDGIGSPAWDILNYQHLYQTQPTCSNDWWVIPTMCINLNPVAELQSLDFDTDGVADGTGIAFWLNGEVFFMEMAALPAAGTEWQLRAVSGVMTANCTPALGSVMTDCDTYTFSPHPVQGTVVPGLQYVLRVESAATIGPIADGDLDNAHTVPDPYYITSSLEVTSAQKVIKFVNLPDIANIRIYSTAGILVDVVDHDDPRGGGEAIWDVRNRNNQFVASGVYFYHIETPNGLEKVGRFTVVNSSGINTGGAR